MAGINKVIILGNVGRIEVKQTQSGSQVVNLSLATSYKTKDANGQPTEVTEWHNCVFFGKVADIAAQYVTKGTKLYVEGSLKTEKYEKDGIDRYTTKIIVRDMQLLGSKQDGAPSQPSPNAYSAPQNDLPPPSPSGYDQSFPDDDIPF